MKPTTALFVGGLAALTAGCDDAPPEHALPPLLEPREQAQLGFAHPIDDCSECHAQHVEQWEGSNHAYAAKDPVFTAMVRVGQAQSEGKLDQFCVQCHTPPGMASGQTEVVRNAATGVFEQDLSRLGPIAEHGVSCDVCHSITDVVEPVNARAVLTPNGVRRATIADPVPTTAHESANSDLHAQSELCGMCHSVVNPKGALVEETFPEWLSSSFADEGTQCQDCHMPTYEGRAAPDGPVRTLHDHTFVGVDVSLLPPDEFPGYDSLREATTLLLQSSVDFDAAFDGPSRRLQLTIDNLAGHALPSGATAERQMWVELLVVDAAGEVVFESGTLDANDDVRDGVDGHSLAPGSDPQLIYFGQQMVAIQGLDAIDDDAIRAAIRADKEQQCVSLGLGAVAEGSEMTPVTFPWQANWQCNYLIPVDGRATPSFDLSGLASGEYEAHISLKFRTFPPYFLRELEALGGLDPAVKTRLPTVEMASTTLGFAL